MVTISVFGKENCARCKTTKNKLNHFISSWRLDHEVKIVFHDMETLDGRAEGAFYDVNQIPATIVQKDGRSIARWDGEVPNSDSVKQSLELEPNAASH